MHFLYLTLGGELVSEDRRMQEAARAIGLPVLEGKALRHIASSSVRAALAHMDREPGQFEPGSPGRPPKAATEKAARR